MLKRTDRMYDAGNDNKKGKTKTRPLEPVAFNLKGTNALST
jgi:hypothetical protein